MSILHIFTVSWNTLFFLLFLEHTDLDTPLLLPMNYEKKDQKEEQEEEKEEERNGEEEEEEKEEKEEEERAQLKKEEVEEMKEIAGEVCKFDIRCWVIIERYRPPISTTTTTTTTTNNETKETTSSTTTTSTTLPSTTLPSTTIPPVWQVKVFRRPYLRLCGTAYKPNATRSKEHVCSVCVFQKMFCFLAVSTMKYLYKYQSYIYELLTWTSFFFMFLNDLFLAVSTMKYLYTCQSYIYELSHGILFVLLLLTNIQLANPLIHLTNNSVQSKDIKVTNFDELMWSTNNFIQWLSSTQINLTTTTTTNKQTTTTTTQEKSGERNTKKVETEKDRERNTEKEETEETEENGESNTEKEETEETEENGERNTEKEETEETEKNEERNIWEKIIFPQICQLCTATIKMIGNELIQTSTPYDFELLGYDFMIGQFCFFRKIFVFLCYCSNLTYTSFFFFFFLELFFSTFFFLIKDQNFKGKFSSLIFYNNLFTT